MKSCNSLAQKLSLQEQDELRGVIQARFAKLCNALDDLWSDVEKAEDDILHALFCRC